MLWLRREHGGYPVKPLASESGLDWTVCYPAGEKLYEGFRALARDLYGYSSGWTADRYFKIGLYRAEKPTTVLIDLLNQTAKEDGLGVDLENRSDEVAKLLNYSCGAAIRQYGYDFDDVLQDVYKGLIARNRGKSPFDVEKSSFGNYVIMVSQCIFRNYHARQKRIRSREQIGIRKMLNDGIEVVDAAEASVDVEDTDWGQIGVVEVMDDLLTTMHTLEGSHRSEARLARKILPLVYRGMKRSEIANELDIGVALVGRALSWLRGAAREWVEEL